MTVNYYYSDELTNDAEGNLVQLCGNCAKANRTIVQFASRGDEESECELCDAANDADRKQHLDSVMERL